MCVCVCVCVCVVCLETFIVDLKRIIIVKLQTEVEVKRRLGEYLFQSRKLSSLLSCLQKLSKK